MRCLTTTTTILCCCLKYREELQYCLVLWSLLTSFRQTLPVSMRLPVCVSVLWPILFDDVLSLSEFRCQGRGIAASPTHQFNTVQHGSTCSNSMKYPNHPNPNSPIPLVLHPLAVRCSVVDCHLWNRLAAIAHSASLSFNRLCHVMSMPCLPWRFLPRVMCTTKDPGTVALWHLVARMRLAASMQMGYDGVSKNQIQNVWNGNEWNQCGMDDSNNIQNMYKASTKLAHKL